VPLSLCATSVASTSTTSDTRARIDRGYHTASRHARAAWIIVPVTVRDHHQMVTSPLSGNADDMATTTRPPPVVIRAGWSPSKEWARPRRGVADAGLLAEDMVARAWP
jgi:hypothetical protein